MSNDFSFQRDDGSFLQQGGKVVSATGNLTAVRSKHEGRTVRLDKAAGLTVTLPNATGSGDRYRFVVGTTLSAATYVMKVGRSADYVRGQFTDVGSTATGFATANTGTLATESDTVTLNGGTQGGVIGDVVEFEDVAKNIWRVRGTVTASGAGATPFSATV